MRYSTSLSRRRFLKGSADATMALAVAPLPAYAAISPVQSATLMQDANGSSKSSGITRMLADWVVQSRAGDIPANVRKEAVRSIVNSVGATVGGSADEAVTAALRDWLPTPVRRKPVCSGVPPALIRSMLP